jgi:TPR repeat protein
MSAKSLGILLLGLMAGVAWAEGPSDPAAQVKLGLAYIEGDGVPADENKAAELFRSAAQQGNADAQFNLGLLYIRGAGVPKDDVEAYKWLTLAHEAGRTDALSVRDGMAGRMTPEELGKARGLARSWKPTEP